MKKTWLHIKEEVQARREEFLSILTNQYRQSRTGPPDCAVCGRESRSWTDLYRCYQCDLWLCRRCTKEHMPEVRRV